MTETQIKNAIMLCKGQPYNKVLQLFGPFMWRQPQISAMAKYFGCKETKEDVAMALINA